MAGNVKVMLAPGRYVQGQGLFLKLAVMLKD